MFEPSSRRVWLLALALIGGCGRLDFADPVGCSDGSREGFIDQSKYPHIAGCAAFWADAQSLRAGRKGTASCGGATMCDTPANACSPNWHICGLHGHPSELRSQITGDECAQAGLQTPPTPMTISFVAALDHCTSCANMVFGQCQQESDCSYSDTDTYACLADTYCSEPVCCGNGCLTSQACRRGVFNDDAAQRGNTLVSTGTSKCAENTSPKVTSDVLSGVLCCLD